MKKTILARSSRQNTRGKRWLRATTGFVRGHKIVSSIASLAAALIVAAIVIFVVIILNTHKTEAPISSNPAVLAYQNQLTDLQKAVKDNDKSQSAHRNYAVALYATGDYKAAITQYQKLIDLNPKDATAYNNLANAYRDNKQTDKAIESYKKAIQIDKTYINAYSNLANVQLYAKNDSAAAIETYKSGIVAVPNNSQLELLLAIAYERSGSMELANQTYRHILTYDATNVAAKDGADRTEN